MENFVKKTLIPAGILLGTGLLILLLAGFSGGFRQLMDLSSAGLSKIELFGANFELDLNDMHFGIYSDDLGEKNTKSKTIDSAVKGIDVSFNWGDVNINISNRFDKISYTYEGPGKINESIEAGDILRIKTRDKKLFSNSGELTVNIPADMYFDEFYIECGAGNVVIDGDINAEDVNFNIGAGDFEASSIVAENFNCDMGTGDINLEFVDIKKKADLDVGCGEADIVLAGAESDYDFDIDVGLGEYTIGDETSSGIGNERNTERNTNKMVTIDMGTGDVNISFK